MRIPSIELFLGCFFCPGWESFLLGCLCLIKVLLVSCVCCTGFHMLPLILRPRKKECSILLGCPRAIFSTAHQG